MHPWQEMKKRAVQMRIDPDEGKNYLVFIQPGELPTCAHHEVDQQAVCRQYNHISDITHEGNLVTPRHDRCQHLIEAEPKLFKATFNCVCSTIQSKYGE